MTPEGKVKAAVNKVLSKYKTYTFMPVPYGYGKSTLDYLICINGHFVAIETKAPGKSPTARQKTIAAQITAAGGKVFIIADVDATHELSAYLERASHAPRSDLA